MPLGGGHHSGEIDDLSFVFWVMTALWNSMLGELFNLLSRCEIAVGGRVQYRYRCCGVSPGVSTQLLCGGVLGIDRIGFLGKMSGRVLGNLELVGGAFA